MDSLVQYGQQSSLNFYEIQTIREQIMAEASDGQILSVYLRLDPQYDLYERRVYSFGELLGQIGGLYQIMIFAGVLAVGIFSERLYVSSIIRKIYQTDAIRDKQVAQEARKVAPKTQHHSTEFVNVNAGRVESEFSRQESAVAVSMMNVFKEIKPQDEETVK